jgi:flagellar biosynthesis GTPase FlhF
MWIDKAHVFYVEDNKKLKLGHFVLMDVWYTVRNEAKWVTYNNGLRQARKRKGSDKESEGEDLDNPDFEDIAEIPRPMGQKKAKKLAHEKKAKNDTTKDSINLEVEEMKTFGKIQADEHANRLKVLEVQKKLSAEKIEQAKLAHLSAKEQREAAEVQREVKKLELQTKMLETYNNLLAVDVSLMSEEDKLDHTNTLRCFKKKIFDV